MNDVEYAYELVNAAVDAGIAAYESQGHIRAETLQSVDLEMASYRWANSRLLNEEYENAAWGI